MPPQAPVTGSPPPAPASDPAPSLRSVEEVVTVEPGASCLNRERLVQRVARWLERAAVEVPLQVFVRGDPLVSTRVFFSVRTEPGALAERRLDNVPSDCDQLHSAVALSIALAIEATLQQRDAAKGGAQSAPAPAKSPGWQREPPAEPMHLELALLLGASIGVLTDASVAGSPRLSLAPWPWFELMITALVSHLSDQTVENVPGAFSATLWAVGLDACFGAETSQGFGFYMCVGGRGGQFQIQGRDFTSGSEGSAEPWWALAGSGQGRFWISSALAFGMSVEALYATVPRRIVVVGVDGAPDRVRPVSPVGLSVTAGPVFRFF